MRLMLRVQVAMVRPSILAFVFGLLCSNAGLALASEIGPVALPAVVTSEAAPLTDGEHSMPVGRRAFESGKLRVDFGAYFQPGYEYRRDSAFNLDDYDSFAINNARLKGSSALEFRPDWTGRFNLDLDVSTGVFLSKNIYASIAWRDSRFAVDIGQMKVPFLMYDMIPDQGRQIIPGLPLNKLGLGRDRGIRVRGDVPVSGGQLRYWAGIFHGEGPSVLRNVDNRYVYAGRVVWSPRGNAHDAESDLEGGDLRGTLGFSTMYTPSLASMELGPDSRFLEEARGAIEGTLKFHGFSLRAEGLYGSVRPGPLTKGFSRYAVWGGAGYVLPWFQAIPIEPAIRIAQFDFDTSHDGFVAQPGSAAVYGASDSSAQRRLDVGVNLYLSGRKLFVNLAWRRVQFLEGQIYDVGGGPLIGDQFTAYLNLALP